MFRKVTLAIATIAAVGAAAFVPTTASAGWKGGWHHKHWGHGHYYGGPAYVGYSAYGYGCYVKKWIDTPYGPRLRRIYVCY